MSVDALLSALPGAIAVALIAGGVWYLDHINTLGLSFFRPYRGEAWPQGVQEEDAVVWQWKRDAPAVGAADDEDDGPTSTIDLTPVHPAIRRARSR